MQANSQILGISDFSDDDGPAEQVTLPSSPTRIALIGAGRIGVVHAKALSLLGSLVKFAAVVDSVISRAEELAQEFHCEAFSSVEKMIAKIRPDGVIVGTPTKTHAAISRIVLKAGIPALIEKPVSMSVTEIDELYDLAAKHGTFILCAFHRRYDASFTRMRSMIKSGEAGMLKLVHSTSRDHFAPRPEFLSVSGSIMHDMSIHDIDMQRWLIGSDPIEVYATGTAFHEHTEKYADFDVVQIVMKWPNGIISNINNSRSTPYGYDQRVEVLGSEKLLETINTPRTAVVVTDTLGRSQDTTYESFTDRYNGAYLEQMRHFVALISGASPRQYAMVSRDDARKAVVIANAAYRSARENRPVKLDWSSSSLMA